MNEMDIYPIYPKMKLFKRIKYVHIFFVMLLLMLQIRNGLDIIYISIKYRFLYLVIVID